MPRVLHNWHILSILYLITKLCIKLEEIFLWQNAIVLQVLILSFFLLHGLKIFAYPLNSKLSCKNTSGISHQVVKIIFRN